MDLPDISKSTDLYKEAEQFLAGPTMLLSKKPSLYAPDCWPAYYRRAWGSQVEDLDGNVFVDFMGDVGATLLGRADPDVNAAVHQAVDSGNFCLQNCPLDIELAKTLTEIIPSAELVRFVRGGGDADAVAIRIARGYTGKDLVAFCGYHGWHDWYLAANLGDSTTLDGHLLPGLLPVGVPKQLRGTAIPFEYNNVDSLKELLESKPGQFGAIIMETTRYNPPADGFLQGVRELADEHGAVLIFDEVVTGFRMALGGAQEYFDVKPDISTFAKTISNGYPMGAVVGRREIMKTVQNQFISSSYWTDSIGTVAAIASIKKIRETGAVDYVWKVGKELMDGLNDALISSGLDGQVKGYPPHLYLVFNHEDPDTVRAINTMYIRRQLARGFICSNIHYLMTSHTSEQVQDYLAAAKLSMQEIKSALDDDTLMEKIDHNPNRPLFKRLL